MNRQAWGYLAVFAACAAVTALGVLTRPPLPRPDPPPHPWASFPPGSWTERVERAEIGGRSMESTERWEILRRNDDEVVVRIHRGADEEELRIGRRDEPDSPVGAVFLGRETLAIDGRRVLCEMYRRGPLRFWLSTDLPWPVRSISEPRPGEIEEERLEGWGDEQRAGGRTLTCPRFALSRKAAGVEIESATTWRHRSVPGHVVLRERNVRQEGSGLRVRTWAATFHVPE